MKKRILVTGGAGFLGSHFCTKLLSEECEILRNPLRRQLLYGNSTQR
jgi:nucleoside-diphosphate-sugar epimerase